GRGSRTGLGTAAGRSGRPDLGPAQTQLAAHRDSHRARRRHRQPTLRDTRRAGGSGARNRRSVVVRGTRGSALMLILPARNRDLIAPLGLAFSDGPGGSPVLDRLTVRAWPEGKESRQVVATINDAGVAGFHRLPGVKINPADPFAGPTRAFIVEVRDTLSRFQTGQVRVLAPAKGITSVVMRSAPARVVAPARLA